MSKIDELLALADSITASSETLLRSVAELNLVVSLLMEMQHSIVAADTEIDNYTQLISRNNTYLHEIQKLHEKSFFLEANLQTNDVYTNETSYSNLSKEFSYLWRSFGYDNLNFSVEHEDIVPMDLQRSLLNHMLSISNLNLKPLRCRSTKVSKKKSRYRISGAFNFNPLAPNLPQLPDLAPGRDLEIFSDHLLTRYVLNASSEVSSLMDENPHRNSITSTHTVEDRDISMNTKELNHHSFAESSVFGDVSLPFSKSYSPINLDNFDMADVQQLDFDYDSSSPLRSDFDNFQSFLRKSHLDLQESFPKLKKSVSHESIFLASASLKEDVPKKFHNPIDMLNTHKRQTNMQPTVESIYSLSVDAPSNFKELSKKLLADKTKHINVACTDAKDPILTPTRKPSYRLFQLMNSPLGSPRGLNDSLRVQLPNLVKQERKGSIDLISKSLATSFMNLVGTTSSAQLHSVLGTTPGSKSPPEKIKKMKKDLKNPISVQNDFALKRRPPLDQRRNSVHSVNGARQNLRKEPVKKPILGHIKPDLLKEAFKDSLFF